mmetsp:Transcript_13126/g.31063  ORF Transcript_13126/g.31063 Transcript_13126/m.31063 type:complete len:417 (+) Transcript_13126:247-1497(+)
MASPRAVHETAALLPCAIKDAKYSEGVVFFKTFGRFSTTHEGWHATLNKVRNNDPCESCIGLHGGMLRSLTDHGWRLIGTYIARNTHLRTLQVDAESNDQMATIFRNLTGSKCIELLLLGNTGQELSFVPELTSFENLKEFRIIFCRLAPEGLARISRTLQHDGNRLKVLDLDSTGMDDDDVGIIVDALRRNNTLKTLDLSDNSVGVRGLRALLKLVNDVSSIDATLTSNCTVCIHGLASNNNRLVDLVEHGKIRTMIDLACKHNEKGGIAAAREKIVHTQLNSQNRAVHCQIQGIEYTYGSIFTDLSVCVLPEVFSLMGTQLPRTGDLFLALRETVSSWTSLVDTNVMLRVAIEKKDDEVATRQFKIDNLKKEIHALNERKSELRKRLVETGDRDGTAAGASGIDSLAGTKRARM